MNFMMLLPVNIQRESIVNIPSGNTVTYNSVHTFIRISGLTNKNIAMSILLIHRDFRSFEVVSCLKRLHIDWVFADGFLHQKMVMISEDKVWENGLSVHLKIFVIVSVYIISQWLRGLSIRSITITVIIVIIVIVAVAIIAIIVISNRERALWDVTNHETIFK